MTTSTAAAAIREIPHKLLSEMLVVPLQTFPNLHKLPKEPPEAEQTTPHSVDDLRIVQIKAAGDVTHIFSHIKKTYRVQWVLLGGGGLDPPMLARPVPIVGANDGHPSEAKSTHKARKTAGKSAGRHEPTGLPLEGQWTLMDDVPNAKSVSPHLLQARLCIIVLTICVAPRSIGTGVLKVWRQVSTLWARS